MAQRNLSTFEALKTIVDALEPLSNTEREKLLRSAREFLGMAVLADSTGISPGVAAQSHLQSGGVRQDGGDAPGRGKPKSLVELVNEKKPKTNAQMITLFAYYKERHEQVDSFRRGDLKSYFARARQKKVGNYDRDFTQAISNGWISQDSEECYITSTGIEAVESGFSGDAIPPRKIASQKSASKKTPSLRKKARRQK